MTKEEILSQFPEGKLRSVLRELLDACDGMSGRKPVSGFIYGFHLPGWPGFIQEYIEKSNIDDFNKQAFCAGYGYDDFGAWIVEKSGAAAQSYDG